MTIEGTFILASVIPYFFKYILWHLLDKVFFDVVFIKDEIYKICKYYQGYQLRVTITIMKKLTTK